MCISYVEYLLFSNSHTSVLLNHKKILLFWSIVLVCLLYTYISLRVRTSVPCLIYNTMVVNSLHSQLLLVEVHVHKGKTFRSIKYHGRIYL